MYYKMTVGKKTYKSFIDWTWIEHMCTCNDECAFSAT